MCRFTPRIRPRRRDTTSTLAPAVFRARSGTISSTFSKPSAARAAIVRPLSRRLVGMSSPCRWMAQRWRNFPWQRKPRSGRRRAVHSWLAAHRERGTHTRQLDTSPGELKPDRPVVGPASELTGRDDGHDPPHTPSTLLLSGHAVVGVGNVDSCGAHLVELFAVPGDGVGEVDDVEDLGAAEAGELHSTHALRLERAART